MVKNFFLCLRQSGVAICDSSRHRRMEMTVRDVDTGRRTRRLDRTVVLGRQADRILAVDQDPGRSGSSAVARTGLQQADTEIGLDHLGLVAGIEMARPPRAGRDSHLHVKTGTHLLDGTTAWPSPHPLLTLLAWCRQSEAGFGEASVDEVAAVLDPAEAVSECADEVVGFGEGGVGLAGAS
ncbi:hypothetical protein ACFV2H_28780 [Streptomyces sp. NPDC059629]|uniref:hypothetical protein n=1 Tax=Streptomyces sp. NPDC059629 TaxID=3346889 RepID=UPI0036C1186E